MSNLQTLLDVLNRRLAQARIVEADSETLGDSATQAHASGYVSGLVAAVDDVKIALRKQALDDYRDMLASLSTDELIAHIECEEKR